MWLLLTVKSTESLGATPPRLCGTASCIMQSQWTTENPSWDILQLLNSVTLSLHAQNRIKLVCAPTKANTSVSA
jgi:hypothetical protein